MKADTVSVEIDVDSSKIDEATEKITDLVDVVNELSPLVNIRNCRKCTFYIYPGRITWKDVDE